MVLVHGVRYGGSLEELTARECLLFHLRSGVCRLVVVEIYSHSLDNALVQMLRTDAQLAGRRIPFTWLNSGCELALIVNLL